MSFSLRLSLTAICFLLAARAMVAAPAERSISTSRQFIAYGADVRLRGAICDLAERTKENLLLLIDRRDEWTTPIVLNIQYPQANLPELPRANLNFSQTGFGLKLQLDLTIGADVNRTEIQRELLRAILIEMMYRRSPGIAAGTTYVSPPDWLLEGTRTRESDFDPAALVEVLKTPVAARKILPLAEFLRPRTLSGLDAPAHSLYRAYSYALLDLLLHLPDGRRRLGHFIDDLPSASNNPMADLQTHFPDLIDASGSAEKMWAKHIAQLSIGQPFQLLAAAETGLLLDKLLHLKIRAAGSEKNYQLDEFAQFIRAPSARLALIGLNRDLLTFATRANPIYRPVISEYGQIAELLLRKKTRRLRERLAQLKTLRESIAHRMREIDDYMNWFEVTNSRAPSGAFADYFKAAESAAQPAQRRRDPISVYLDTLETQFQN